MSAEQKAVVEAAQPFSGVVKGLDATLYHASHALSNSGMTDLERSPAHYWSMHVDLERPPRREKAGQLEGNLLHCALLEPDEFAKRYAVGPSVNRNTKVWKEFVASQPDFVPIQLDQMETAFAQAASARAIPDVASALSSGHAEVSAFWRDPETGVPCRCRPDFVHETKAGVVLLDAKTYSSAQPAEFARQAARKLYHRQAAYYSDGYAIAASTTVLAFLFIAIETDYPYGASAIMLDDDALQAGRARYRRNLNLYAECLASGQWPPISTAIELVSLPAYALE